MDIIDIIDRMEQNNEKHHHDDNDDSSFVLIDPSCAKNDKEEEETAEIIMDDEEECYNPAKRRKTTTKLKERRRRTAYLLNQKWTLQPRPFIPMMTTTTSTAAPRGVSTISWNNNGEFDNSDSYKTTMEYDNWSYNYNTTAGKDKIITPPLPSLPPFDQNPQQRQTSECLELKNDGSSCQSPLPQAPQKQEERVLPVVLTPPIPFSQKFIVSSSLPPPVIGETTRTLSDNNINNTSMATPTTSPIHLPQQPPKIPFLNLPNLGEGDSFSKKTTTFMPYIKLMLKEQQTTKTFKLLPRRPSRHTHCYQQQQHGRYSSTIYEGYQFDEQ